MEGLLSGPGVLCWHIRIALVLDAFAVSLTGAAYDYCFTASFSMGFTLWDYLL